MIGEKLCLTMAEEFGKILVIFLEEREDDNDIERKGGDMCVQLTDSVKLAQAARSYATDVYF